MDKGIILRIISFALIPIILYWIILSAMKEGKKEEERGRRSTRIIVRLPKALWLIAIIGILFYTCLMVNMIVSRNETEPLYVYIFFSFAILFSAYILYISLIWRIEVPKNEDYFVLRDCWGKRYIIQYSDCVSYQYRRQEIVVRNRIKNFTMNGFLVNYAVFIAMLNQHHVKREKDG